VLGIYVHLPFCPYICPYCDFAKWPYRRSAAQRYLAALDAEIARTPSKSAATIFYGGGTPNSYDAQTIGALTRRLRERFPVPERFAASDQEISIEVNPELVQPGDFDVYRDAGINRVSIGVQSFDPEEIATLGRKHTPEQVESVVQEARRAGIPSVSLDLIFAVPGQTPETWRASLERAIALDADHVSTYGLTVEDDTPYAVWQAREPQAFFDDTNEAEFYRIAIEMLEAAGYRHYEISNFARDGHRCKHNLNYWDNGDYLGFGVGAASYREGVRSTHTRSLDGYVLAAMAGEAIPGESERLEGFKRVGEAVMLALRTAQGVCIEAFNERYGIDFMQHYASVVANLTVAGLVVSAAGFVRLTQRGRFVANDACAAFISSE
jgi:oxygen-independent coproporphyrinogen-3 oxidase